MDEERKAWGEAFGEAIGKVLDSMRPPIDEHNYIIYINDNSPFTSNRYTIQAVSFEHAYTIATMKSGKEHIVQILHEKSGEIKYKFSEKE